MEFSHVSVLLDEAVGLLNLPENAVCVDATLGGGGHSARILETYCPRLLIGIDQDEEAIQAAAKRLSGYEEQFLAVRDNFKNVKQILNRMGIERIHGAVMDLGVSSHQLDEAERGFSYMKNAPLDMRMDKRQSLSAFEVVNNYSEQALADMIFRFGEDRNARKIAAEIVRRRAKAPIRTTLELADAALAVPGAQAAAGHPAKRLFQAVRIEVNGELAILRQAILDFEEVLAPGGVLAVITFHSLEDRIVKDTFRSFEAVCTCPKDFPVCVCGAHAVAKVLTKKPILPSEEEMENNPRAKSAKLRGIQKL